MRFMGSMGTVLEGLRRASRAGQEGYSHEETGEPGGGLLGLPDQYWLELTLLVLMWTFAIFTAVRCGGNPAELVAAVLEPYVYLLIRLVVPCVRPASG